ncbi:acetyl-CoA carboxylase biotin carboxylase subunit family protein [Cyclobacterium xiamenense]|uniref:ATP-grasp domain-containing protein n=1 Tax=Cyclobacterium xiamenense TaxID=1297121 RepID=UPI0035D06657
MSKLLIIGAGWEQESLILEAKRLGHFVVATHPQLNTTGLSHADVFFVKDSLDIASHMQIAKTYNVDGIVTDNCDFSLYTAAVLSKALGIKFNSIQSALYSNNKFEQREACSAKGIMQPEYNRVRTFEELETASNNLGYPLIIKPVDSRGTFGVTIVNSEENLSSAFYDALCNSASHTVICERFIEGTLVTVDGFVFKNGHHALAVASRSFQEGIKPVTKEIIYPARFNNDLNVRLMQNHDRVVSALGYSQGHTHGEYIVTKDQGIYLVECTNRGGGVYTSSTIVPSLTGINLNEILINQSLDRDMFEVEGKGPELMQNSAILTFLDFEVGKVIKSINTEEVSALEYVLKYRTIFSENDMIESIENCASRHSMLAIRGENVDESLNNLENFKSALNVQYFKL